jgi:flagellar biosynthesis protein FlhB
MSDQPDRESKTEEPTAQKLEQAKKKGDGVKTMDLVSFATLAASTSVILMAGSWLCRSMATQLMPFLSHPQDMSVHAGGGVEIFRVGLMAALPALLIVMLATGASGAAASLLQSGLRFTPDKLKPDWSKLSIGKGLVRIFGPDGMMQFVKSLVKVAMTGVIGYWMLKPYVSQFPQLAALDPMAMLPFSIDILKRLVFAVAGLTLSVAAFDWLWQRQRFMTRMRMTREEVKQDYKQSEGDPHVRARQKQIRHDRARRRMMAAVPTATVVVMNPTHYAVALKYEQGEDAAPLCVAKGLDAIALRIRAVAEDAGVPIIEDAPLARALYAAVDIDELIPPAHYEAVAKIIGFILGAGRRRATARPL